MDQLTVSTPGESRWTEVSWQRPLQSKGQMTGYVLVALAPPSQKCVSAVKWVCTDCNANMSAEQVGYKVLVVQLVLALFWHVL